MKYLNMRTLGIAMAIAGNVMVAIAFPAALGNVGEGDPRLLLRYIPMLLIGFGLASLAIRVAGAWLAFYAVFLSVGLGSLWSAFRANDISDRLFNLWMGVIFTSVALLYGAIQLAAKAFSSSRLGQAVSMLPMAAAWQLTPDMRATVLKRIDSLHADGTIDDAQLAQAKAALSGGAMPGYAPPNAEAVAQLDALHAQGLVTTEQLNMIKSYWGGTTPPDGSPSPTT